MPNMVAWKPLWSPKAIFWVGLFCSFFLSALMQAINFGRMGQPETRWRIALFSIVGSLIFLFLRPDRPPFDNDFILLAFNGVISYGISRMHVYAFTQYRAAGGKTISIGKTVVFAVAGVVAVLLSIFGIAYLSVLLKIETS
jgi:hypothetical protein